MKKYFLFYIMMLVSSWLFARGSKETPIEGMVKEWGNNFTIIVIIIIGVLCIVGLFKYLSNRK